MNELVTENENSTPFKQHLIGPWRGKSQMDSDIDPMVLYHIQFQAQFPCAISIIEREGRKTYAQMLGRVHPRFKGTGGVARNVQLCLIHCSLFSAHKWFTFLPHAKHIPPLLNPPKVHPIMASSSGLKSRILSSKSGPGCCGRFLRFLEALLSSWEDLGGSALDLFAVLILWWALVFICILRPSFTSSSALELIFQPEAINLPLSTFCWVEMLGMRNSFTYDPRKFLVGNISSQNLLNIWTVSSLIHLPLHYFGHKGLKRVN